MAGELRATLVAENRRLFGPKPGEAEHGALEHFGLNPQALAAEHTAGKTVVEPSMHHLHHKLQGASRHLAKAGTSTMAKSLMAEETGKALAQSTAKSGAQKLAGKAAGAVGGKLIPVIGQYELAATGINVAQDALNEAGAAHRKAAEAEKKNKYADEAGNYGESAPTSRLVQKIQIPEKYKLPTLGTAVSHGAEQVLTGKNARDLAGKYPQYASKPQSKPGKGSGYGSKPLE